MVVSDFILVCFQIGEMLPGEGGEIDQVMHSIYFFILILWKRA